MNNISRRRVYWHTPAASLSCINGKQTEVELLLISVYVFRSRAQAASMCVHALASVHNAGSRRACKCQQWDSHAWFKIYTCVRVRAYVCIQCVFACSCVYVHVYFYACACVLCVHYVHSLLWQYPNLERKCIFEQRTLTRWPAQVNLCVCNSEKCVCVTLGIFQRCYGPVWIHEPQGENGFYLLRPSCARAEEKRGEKFAKFSQYRMKTFLFIMQTRKLPKQIMAKFN